MGYWLGEMNLLLTWNGKSHEKYEYKYNSKFESMTSGNLQIHCYHRTRFTQNKFY
jgi:hypothetical protein